MDADMNNQEVQNALWFAVVQYNSGSDSIYIRQPVNMIKAQMHVRYFTSIYVFTERNFFFIQPVINTAIKCYAYT